MNWHDRGAVSSNNVRFEPLRPVSRRRLVLAIVLGPILWLVAFTVAAWFLVSTRAIQLGLLITLASFVVGFLLLLVLRTGRLREERRYVDRR